MKIEMLSTRKCKVGPTIMILEAGEVYDLDDDSIVEVILTQGWGAKVDGEPVEATEAVEEELEGRAIFEAMTINELNAYAEEAIIDLGEAKKKSAIVDAIMAVLEGSEDETEEETEEESDEDDSEVKSSED